MMRFKPYVAYFAIILSFDPQKGLQLHSILIDASLFPANELHRQLSRGIKNVSYFKQTI